MPSSDFVKVEVLVNNQPVPEYNVPEDEGGHSQESVKYIATQPDRSYAIRFTLLQGFKREGANVVTFRPFIDGMFLKFCCAYGIGSAKWHAGRLLADTILGTFSEVSVLNEQLHQWRSHSLSFGELSTGTDFMRFSCHHTNQEIVEGIQPASQLTLEAVKGLGSIRIE